MDSKSNNELVVLYVQLLDEGTYTFRPTSARTLGGGLYELLPTPKYDPEDEKWEFLPGSIVRAVAEKLDGENVLVARAP